MAKVKSVCVYCGSSEDSRGIYRAAAQRLGVILAHNNIRLIYGGGKMGTMGSIADSALAEGGEVYGFIPNHLDTIEEGHTNLTKQHIVGDMHERKLKMFQHSDAFIVLPGGFGTLDEIFEVLTWRQIQLHSKPIVIVDLNNYWSGLFDSFVHHMVREKFVEAEDLNFYNLVKSVEDILPTLESLPVDTGPDLVSKWG